MMKFFIKLFFALSIIIGLAATVYLYDLYQEIKNDIDSVVNYQPKQSTQFFDRNGKLLANTFKDENREYVKYDDIPARIIEALVAIEDTQFFEHYGVNPDAISRAMIKNIKAGGYVEGASTLTQQLIKMLVLTREKKLIRKVKENVTLETQKDKKSNTEILSNAYSEFSTSKIEKQVEASKINLEPSKDVYLNLNSTINNFSNMASTNNNYILKGKVFDAIEVNMNQNVNYELKETDKKIEIPTSHLLVIDGKVIKNKYSNDNIEASSEQIKEDEDVETVIVLKEPLYIINGMEYTEESLFGKNPTSPYAPLNKQKIKSVEVLQAPEAQARFGEKGKKGVVMITTKNGKFTKKVLN